MQRKLSREQEAKTVLVHPGGKPRCSTSTKCTTVRPRMSQCYRSRYCEGPTELHNGLAAATLPLEVGGSMFPLEASSAAELGQVRPKLVLDQVCIFYSSHATKGTWDTAG